MKCGNLYKRTQTDIDQPEIEITHSFIYSQSVNLTNIDTSFLCTCPLIDDKMMWPVSEQLRKDIKNWPQFVFYNNKSSEKSNLLVNTKMTFLNECNIIVNSVSRLVIGYRRQTTVLYWLKIWQVELRHCPA